jgi:predicted enzyme related to lactoylglutathione lyase
MGSNIRPGAVIFTGDLKRLAKFYEAVTGLAVRFADDGITVLGSDTFELVIHSLPGEPAVNDPPAARQDTYIKPFFPVASLSETRERAAALGGKLRPENEEWAARGFRACEAIDPDGNVIQFREEELQIEDGELRIQEPDTSVRDSVPRQQHCCD